MVVYKIDESINKQFESSRKEGSSLTAETGLLIGSRQHGILCAVPTPVNDEQATTGSVVDHDWIISHAEQVLTMLPGGLSILGIYMRASDPVLSKSGPDLQKCVSLLGNDFKEQFVLLLLIEANSNKLSGSQFNVQDKSSTPTTFETKNLISEFHRVDASFGVDQLIPVASNSKTSQIIEDVISQVSGCMGRGLLSLDGSFVEPSRTMAKIFDGRKSDRHTVEVHRMDQSKRSFPEPTNPTVHVKGNFTLCAIVNDADASQTLQRHLREDLERSLRASFSLLTNSTENPAKDAKAEILARKMPTRMVFAWPTKPGLALCDYLSVGETWQDVADRTLEYMGLEAQMENGGKPKNGGKTSDPQSTTPVKSQETTRTGTTVTEQNGQKGLNATNVGKQAKNGNYLFLVIGVMAILVVLIGLFVQNKK